MALIGGETAELPDFYTPGEYDLAGFIVGLVDQDAIVNSANLQAGDVCLGLASTGLHTNGYTLARAVLLERAGLTVHLGDGRRPSQIAVDLEQMNGRRMVAWWFNPRTGVWLDAGSGVLAADATGKIDLPLFPGDSAKSADDWGLKLKLAN